MVGMLLTLPASSIFPLQLYASLPQAHNWLWILLWACILFHPRDVASPAQLRLMQDGLYVGQAGSFDDFFV